MHSQQPKASRQQIALLDCTQQWERLSVGKDLGYGSPDKFLLAQKLWYGESTRTLLQVEHPPPRGLCQTFTLDVFDTSEIST